MAAGWLVLRAEFGALAHLADACPDHRDVRRSGRGGGRGGAADRLRLSASHTHLGETVPVSLAGFRPHPLTIVGTAVFPNLGDVLGQGRYVAR